jgi:hypothetical protein
LIVLGASPKLFQCGTIFDAAIALPDPRIIQQPGWKTVIQEKLLQLSLT